MEDARPELAASRNSERYEWSLVILLALMWGFVGLNRAGVGYIMPLLVQDFGFPFWQAGLLVSGTSVAWAVSAWASGSISDRVGRKNVLLVGMYAACAFAALFGLAWNFISLFVARDLLGFGDGVGYTTGQSTIAERTNPNRRALYQGIFTGGYSILGLGFGAFIVTHLATAFGWRWVFPVIALFGVVITTGLWVLLPRDRPAAERPAEDRLSLGSFFKDLREIVRVRGVVAVIIAGTLGLAWLGLYIAFASLFLVQVRGYSLNEAGNILSISTIIGFIGPLVVPAISDVVGRRPTAIVAALGAGICYLIFPLVPMPTVPLTIVLTIGGICGGGLAPLTLATFFSELVPLRRGAAIGIANFFSATCGATLSPILGGILADHYGLIAPLVLAGACQLVIAPVLLGVPETAPRVLARIAAATGHQPAHIS